MPKKNPVVENVSAPEFSLEFNDIPKQEKGRKSVSYAKYLDFYLLHAIPDNKSVTIPCKQLRANDSVKDASIAHSLARTLRIDSTETKKYPSTWKISSRKGSYILINEAEKKQ